MPQPHYRPINRALGRAARFGPIPAALLIPFLLAALIAYLFYALGGTMLAALFLGGSLLTTWWLVSGGNSFLYISRYSRWWIPHWQRTPKQYRAWIRKTED